MTRPTQTSRQLLAALVWALGACSLNPQPEPPMDPTGTAGFGHDAGAGGGAAGNPSQAGGSSGAAGSIPPADASAGDGCEGDYCKCAEDGGVCDASCDATGDAVMEDSPEQDADAEPDSADGALDVVDDGA